ncbi:uncharacterized protein B0J16DRAFT_338716 [Fusarium flagelliforme]|uniref:uncharacterized protein n=1 Tax=Fusarium flagelliforme TaxID=2675880 RepID=UPI001E8EE9DF|nr:uncharacterized protein B0J16DRAFT_338716 [Fusarium flagelliforme]KAH7189059.1 hypothetical protein B0J16DRAFT_338716 [Fusarium flagelliforme]
MAGLEYRDSFETALKQDDQPQPVMTQDRASSAVRGPLWTVKLNIRLLSISIDALLLIIVPVLAAGSSHDITPVIAFGPLLVVTLIWSFIVIVQLWTTIHQSLNPSIHMYFDLILSIAFIISSVIGGYFGPVDHQVSDSTPTKDESHLGRRTLGCFGIAKVFIHILLAAISYYERKTQTSQSKAIVPSQDEEERLLFDEESVSHR